MSRSSEEVLLIVNNVRNKKSDGTLYMMGARMAWMQESKSSFSISHHYADIKVQKVSPDTKPKIQLQVVKHDNSADTFHFSNAMGREAQAKDRESVKDLLQQLLPKFRVKVNSELEQKNRMLQEDPELFQLYKDLVVAQIVTADEFWANRVQKAGPSSKKIKQEVGISAAFLADIQPQTDGCNGLKYNLTTDIIESIFRTYPAVKKKHLEYVPDKMAEAEFWTKFFQSHYFHRDRFNFTAKDLFADCAKNDDKIIFDEKNKPLDDPSVDMKRMADNDIGEGYGMDKDNDKKSFNSANASLMRRFNQHSTMVLQAGQRASSSTATGSDTQTNGSTPATSNSSNHKHKIGNDHQIPLKKVKLKEKTEFEDLDSLDNSAAGPTLRLKRADRYLHGPTPAQALSYTNSQDMGQQQQAVRSEIYHWQPSYKHVLPANVSLSVLQDLSPGGALMKTYSDHQLHQIVGPAIEEEVQHTYSALLELLRHFWSCFPTSSPFLEEKVIRMKENLERFHGQKLAPLKQKLAQFHYNMNLAGHMEEMLAAAYNKFNTWQTRRMNRK